MKIFVFEYVTGGGLYREPLPPSLMHEGNLMLQNLLSDLDGVPDAELVTSRDIRLSPLQHPVETVLVSPDGDFQNCLNACITQADAVWLIAPESGGVLKQLSDQVLDAGKMLLGSAPQAIELTTYKSVTSAALARHGVPVVSCRQYHEMIGSGDTLWVAKPDDGVGCEDTCRFSDLRQLAAWMQLGDRSRTHVVQPFLTGVPASISVLCKNGQAWLLSCNRQLIRIEQERFSYHGSVLNGMQQYWTEFDTLAQQIAQAVPGLAGHVGIDLMVDGNEMTVLEINPRLTTSYVGLRQATGCNPARLVLDLFYNDIFDLPLTMARNVVEISLDE